ncbi:MAG: hypothetical protein ACFFGZ_10990 [Candidatus Thorarchaeota archaeon]
MPAKTFCPNCGTPFFPGDQFCSGCGDCIPVPPPPAKTPRHESPIAAAAQIAEYQSNIQIIGILEIVGGILALIGGFLAAIAGIILPTLIMTDGSVTHGSEANTTAEFPAAAFVGILAFILAILLFIYAIGAIVSGRRLLQYENSGRIGTMIIGAISLISFPLGTIFGIAALYILSRPEVEQLFSQCRSVVPVLS